MRKNVFISGLLFIFCVAVSYAQGYKNGLVVSAHPEASKVGVDILKKGGNAIDAAIATNFALAVVYPVAGNIAGGGFMVYRASDGKVQALDFREKAPLKASRNMYLDKDSNVIKRLSLDGALAVGVPGAVAGMLAMHEKFGKLPWKELIQPAVDLAEKGFLITKKQAERLNTHQKDLDRINASSRNYLRGNGEWKKGDRLQQQDLANVLKLIRDKKGKGFYRGTVAKLIVAQMKKSGGIISKKDLRKYNPVWREAVKGQYKNYTIYSMPPPSSGGIVLLQILKMIENKNIGKYKYHRDSMMQLLVEAERRAYADRASYLGDPDFFKVPKTQLLDSAYLAKRMSNFSWNKATLSKDIREGKLYKESEETTHFSVIDKDGNAVSITTTLNGAYGSKLFVQGGGFVLNNEMDDFSIKPGYPNMFGLIGGEANSVAPKKRMLSSMTPSIVEKNGKLNMILGSPGGSTIITTVLQVFLNVSEFGQNIQEAVASPRFHHQWLPDVVMVEHLSDFDKGTLKKMEDKGYTFKDLKRGIGQADCIQVSDDGLYFGGADPRGDNTASGY